MLAVAVNDGRNGKDFEMAGGKMSRHTEKLK
jgi:hypothetical protein